MSPSAAVPYDAMLKRFETTVEVFQRQLFRLIALCAGEDVAGMSMKQLYERMVSLGVIDDLTSWLDAVSLRNEIVHGYPDDPALRAEALNKVFRTLAALKTLRARAEACVVQENLLSAGSPP